MTNEMKAKVITASLDDAFCDGFVSSELSVFNSPKYAVFPGFCDVHVHFREPGFSYKETIETGSKASARGGYTAVCTMPNLNPVPDSVEHLNLQRAIIERDACIHVYPYGAITVGQKGEQMADLEGMAKDVIAFSDDGRGVQSGEMMKAAMEKAKELNFENRVTYITKYKDFLIVSLHFHGFYIYKISNDGDIISCIYKYIVEEKPRTARAIEFQNSVVFEADAWKVNIAFASYSYGITVFTYDLAQNLLSPCCDLNPKAFPDMYHAESGMKNTVFGITSKGSFVYGGITPGHSRFYETYKDADPKRVEKLKKVDWSRFDRRGVIYGPHNRLAEEHYHMELPDADKPEYIGVIAGDPSPSFLCTAGNHLLFNLDKQGLGIARIENDGKLTYIGRALEDGDGRMLTYRIYFDGEFLYTSYKMPVPSADKSPVFRIYKVRFA